MINLQNEYVFIGNLSRSEVEQSSMKTCGAGAKLFELSRFSLSEKIAETLMAIKRGEEMALKHLFRKAEVSVLI